MERNDGARIGDGSLKELVRATELGARIAARGRRDAGEDGETIRREVDDGYRAILVGDEYMAPLLSTLMDAVHRAVEEVLTAPIWPLGASRAPLLGSPEGGPPPRFHL